MKTILDQLGGSLANLGGLGDKLNATLGNVASSAKQTTGGGLLDKLSGAGVGGMLGSAALGGLLGTLLSGKTARKVAQGALVVGGTAAAGALAWNFYQKWSASKESANGSTDTATQPSQSVQPQQPVQTAAAPAGWPAALANTPDVSPSTPVEVAASPDPTALLLLEAMVFAARADGHIDDKERANIHTAVTNLFPGQHMAAVLDEFMGKPLDPTSLAARIRNHEEARDLYRLSCMIIDVDHFMERGYLDGLAAALRLTPEEKAGIDAEVATAQTALQA